MMTSSIVDPGEHPKHPEFYAIHIVTFLVEGCLFRVPRRPLEEESTVFADMFLLPQGDKATVEGQSDYNPIVLQGINKSDFEQLLKVLLSRKYVVGKSPESSLSLDQWVSVLKLSSMWEFHAPRTAAINHLTILSGSIDPVDKLVLAIQFEIKVWMLPTLLKLAQRAEPISIEEGRRIGFETALKLSAVREKVKLGCGHQCQSCAWQGKHINSRLVVGDRDPMTQGLDFTPLIQTTFNL